jgi:hypothetical protein
MLFQTDVPLQNVISFFFHVLHYNKPRAYNLRCVDFTNIPRPMRTDLQLYIYELGQCYSHIRSHNAT